MLYHEFKITMPADERGQLARHCPVCNKYFAIHLPKHWPDFLYCPYCGKLEDFIRFHTLDQKKLIQGLRGNELYRMKREGEIGNESFQELAKELPSLSELHVYEEHQIGLPQNCHHCGCEFSTNQGGCFCPSCGKPYQDKKSKSTSISSIIKTTRSSVLYSNWLFFLLILSILLLVFYLF